MIRRQQIREGLRQPPDCVWQGLVRWNCGWITFPMFGTDAVGEAVEKLCIWRESIRLVGKDTP